MMRTDATEQTEQNFYQTILSLYNVEMQLNNLLPNVADKLSDKMIRHRIGRLQNYANQQLQRVEEIFDIYEIPLENQESVELIGLNNEIKNNFFDKNEVMLNTSDIMNTTENIKTHEVHLINTGLNLAGRLGYTEAQEILSDALASEKRIQAYMIDHAKKSSA